jgi:hypothetical protein
MKKGPHVTDAISFVAELEELHATARRLPNFNGTVKLHALLARVTEALHNGDCVAPAAAALAAAAAASLANHPWVQFAAAARVLCERTDAHDRYRS